MLGRRDGVCITQSQVVATTSEDPEADDWSRDHGTRVCQPINSGGVLALPRSVTGPCRNKVLHSTSGAAVTARASQQNVFSKPKRAHLK